MSGNSQADNWMSKIRRKVIKVFRMSSDSDIDIFFHSDTDSILEDYSSESSTSDDEERNIEPRRKMARIQNFVERIIQEYDEQQFKAHFRLTRATFSYVLGMFCSANVIPTYTAGRKNIAAEKYLYMTLWYLSNQESYRQISDRFDVTQSAAHRCINIVIQYLVDHSNEFIVWPKEDSAAEIEANFQGMKGIRGVLGAIDGCHISIKKPNQKIQHNFCNRYKSHSILLQGVCDDKKRFVDIFAGEPGSIHDARMLRRSSLYERCNTNNLLGQYFILGDSAYPNLPWLVPPFKDNGNLSAQQKEFNYKHSATRVVIENAYGLLKGRFRRLKMFENNNISFITKSVVAACVLHNICIDLNDGIQYEEKNLASDDNQIKNNENLLFNTRTNIDRRQEVFSDMFNN